MTTNSAPTINTKNKSKYILWTVLSIMLITGLAASYWLTQQSQDIRQQASEGEYDTCSGTCVTSAEFRSCSDISGMQDGTGSCDETGGICCENKAADTCTGVCVGNHTSCDEIGYKSASGSCESSGGICCTRKQGEACGDTFCDNDEICIKDECKDKSNYECVIGDSNACGGNPDQCHCTGGDACTGTVCDPDIKTQCENQDRAYCDNYQGFGKTCCVEGYVCCADTSTGGPGCCDGGSNDGDGDGDGGNNPTPTPSPSVSPSPGPQCLNITMDNPGAELGDQTTFTCGAVSGINHYIFRIMSPDGIISDLDATGRVSSPYTIDQSGTYYAQCQICTGTDNSTCHDWEPLP